MTSSVALALASVLAIFTAALHALLGGREFLRPAESVFSFADATLARGAYVLSRVEVVRAGRRRNQPEEVEPSVDSAVSVANPRDA